MSTPFFICHMFIICISIINLSLTFYSPLPFPCLFYYIPISTFIKPFLVSPIIIFFCLYQYNQLESNISTFFAFSFFISISMFSQHISSSISTFKPFHNHLHIYSFSCLPLFSFSIFMFILFFFCSTIQFSHFLPIK